MEIQHSLFILLVVYCLFLAWVSFFKGKLAGSKTFSLLCLLIIVWASATFFEEESIAKEIKYYLVRIDYVSAIFIGFVYYLFCQQYTENTWNFVRLLSKSFSLLSIIAASLVLFTNVVVSDVLFDGKNIRILNGNGYYFYTILIISMFFSGTYLLFFNLRSHKVSKEKKLQVLYIILALSISAMIATTTNLIIPKYFNVSYLVPRLGIFSIVIFLSAITLSVVKSNLFNIKVLATELFVGILILLILFRTLNSKTIADIIIESVLLSLSILVGSSLVKSVRSEVNRREELEKLYKERAQTLEQLQARNKNLATLQRMSQLVLNDIELKPMTQKILNEIPQQLDNCLGALLDINREGHLVSYAISQTPFSKKIFDLVGMDLEKYDKPLQKGYSRLHDVLLERKNKESNDLADFLSPPLSRPVVATISRIIGVKHSIAFPLLAGDELLGTLMFAYKVPKSELTDRDYNMAQAIADEMSLAIQRAIAFQKLKDANAYLSELDKMKDEFFSMASHELNTPLAAIEGYLSMILDENMGKVDPKAREYLNRAYDSSKRLGELILDLLNVSRIEQGRLKLKYDKVNFYDIALNIIHELQIKADAKKLYLKLEGDRDKLPLTWVDPDRVREVIANLVGNAIKFTEKGGVTIKIEHIGNRLQVAVKDTGRGISKHDQNKLFQKFSQIKKAGDDYHMGTGLGLYISKNFVELQGGRMWVDSDEGKGATFYFELPILKNPPKEVKGAQLLPTVSSPQIEVGKKDIPAIVKNGAR